MIIDYAFDDGSVRKMKLVIGQYRSTDNLYMGLRSLDGTEEMPLTVNVEKLGYPYSTLDVNNMGGSVTAFMEQSGIARFVGQTIPGGFCSYPVFAFDTGVLKQIDERAFDDYRSSHGFLSDAKLRESRRLDLEVAFAPSQVGDDWPEGLYALGSIGATTYVAEVCRLDDYKPGFMGVDVYEMGDASRERKCFTGVIDSYPTVRECVMGIAEEHTPLEHSQVAPRLLAEHQDSFLFDEPCREAARSALDGGEKGRALGDLTREAKSRAAEKNARRTRPKKEKGRDLGR